MEQIIEFFSWLDREEPGLALLLSLGIGVPGFFIACYQVLLPPVSVFISKVILRRENLTGIWILAIYKKPNEPYKIDKYTIRHRGNRLKGRIQRVYSKEDEAQVQMRKYYFEGFYHGAEIIYSFWPAHPAVHSYGCCDLKRAYDFTYKGYYYVPLGKQGARKRYEILLTRNAEQIQALQEKCEVGSLPYGTLLERLWRNLVSFMMRGRGLLTIGRKRE